MYSTLIRQPSCQSTLNHHRVFDGFWHLLRYVSATDTVSLYVSAVEPLMSYQKGQKLSGFSLEGGESFIIELCKEGHCHDKKHHPTSQGSPPIGLNAMPIASGGDGSPPLSYTDQRLVITYPEIAPCECHWQRCWTALVLIPASERHHSPQFSTWTFEPLTTTLWVWPSRQRLIHCGPVVKSLLCCSQMRILFRSVSNALHKSR